MSNNLAPLPQGVGNDPNELVLAINDRLRRISTTAGADGAAGANGAPGVAGAAGAAGATGATGAGGTLLWGGIGVDGVLNFNGTLTFTAIATTTGAAPNLIYTLIRDAYPSTLTVAAGITVLTANFRIFASSSATINGTLANYGTAGNAGGAASGATGGTAGTASFHGPAAGNFAHVTLPDIVGATSSAAGKAGASGGTGAGTAGTQGLTGQGPADANACIGNPVGLPGTAGGGGGTAGAHAGGSGGGGGTLNTLTGAFSFPYEPVTAMLFSGPGGSAGAGVMAAFAVTPQAGGGGSGGAGGGDGVNAGGGGGGSGSNGGSGEPLVLVSPVIVVGAAGVISADGAIGGAGGAGGAGAAGTAAGGGGGAGGSGGCGGAVILIFGALTSSGAIHANGGAGGAPGAGGTGRSSNDGTIGTTGTAGRAGVVIQLPAATTAGACGGVSVKTGNYSLLSTDNCTLVVLNDASAATFTLPGTPPSATWNLYIQNQGAGALTISRNGLDIDGAAFDLILCTTQGVYLSTDGTNYFTERGGPLAGSTISGATAAPILTINQNATSTAPGLAVFNTDTGNHGNALEGTSAAISGAGVYGEGTNGAHGVHGFCGSGTFGGAGVFAEGSNGNGVIATNSSASKASVSGANAGGGPDILAATGYFGCNGVAFAALTAAAGGSTIFCTDAKNAVDDAASVGSVAVAGGHGSYLVRINSSWRTMC